jgi:mannose-6-phosphate isomerase-like protein (cupin superfamily)
VSQIRITRPDDGEVALSGPVSLRILEDGDRAPARNGRDRDRAAHRWAAAARHDEHDEGFYVVSGTVRFTSGGTWFEAPARTLVVVPPGAPHSFADPADEPAIVLNTFTPDLYIGYFRELRDQIAAGRPLSAELIGEMMRH